MCMICFMDSKFFFFFYLQFIIIYCFKLLLLLFCNHIRITGSKQLQVTIIFLWFFKDGKEVLKIKSYLSILMLNTLKKLDFSKHIHYTGIVIIIYVANYTEGWVYILIEILLNVIILP